MSGGLLIAGHIVEVPGVDIANPHDTVWARLDPGDYRRRATPWVRQIVLHTTKGKWPQAVRMGKGPGGADKVVADFYRGDPNHNAAHIAIDRDGTVACLADLATVCAYHATTANEWSVGIELYQEGDGSVYEAVYNSLCRIVPVICEHLGIPFQIHVRKYERAPLNRLIDGGRDVVGIYGHRDQTSRRGHGDPGDLAYTKLVAVGAEPFDYSLKQEVFAWKRRQLALNKLGAKLTVDGVCGPGTIAAMRLFGFAHGRDIPA